MTCRALLTLTIRLLIAIGLVQGVLSQEGQWDDSQEVRRPAPSLSPDPAIPLLPDSMLQTFRAQLALARMGFSPGSIDGVMGQKTSDALRAFQLMRRLPLTGRLDMATTNLLVLHIDPFRYFAVSSNDLARLHPMGTTWLSKSQQGRLDYENLLEMVAEASQSSPSFIQRLNPGFDWSRPLAGAKLVVPNAGSPYFDAKAAYIRISLAECLLQAWGDQTNLLAQFPCSIGREFHQRPVGDLEVAVIIPDPNYTFNPSVFPESKEGRHLGRKLIIPPGPNNPVGIAWIGLNLPGYGIHGTPSPEQVGRAESHGCFRLANWNAELLTRLVWISMPVQVVEDDR